MARSPKNQFLKKSMRQLLLSLIHGKLRRMDLTKVAREDLEKLQALRRDSAEAREVFDALHGYSKKLEETEVDRLVKTTHLKRGQVIRVLRKLDEIKVGRFVVGRHEGKSRMEWGGLNYKKVIPKAKRGEGSSGGPSPDGMKTSVRAGFETLNKWRIRLARGKEAVLLLPLAVTLADVAEVRAFCDRFAERLR